MSIIVPAVVDRTVSMFLTTVDDLAPGLVTGFYLVGSVCLDDFHPTGAGRGPRPGRRHRARARTGHGGRLGRPGRLARLHRRQPHLLRTGGAEGRRGYRDPVARRRDSLAFVDATIDSALELR
ncbi:hypothetical protein [Actinocrispum wychmicini]|uniref:hypothetical protein n=1 Tax=Actinocrispum wychmicini TaxID=1213861 RepID=UPI001049AA2A|nr:hypothetical protein [Actinocrispum wychmicini]